MKPIRVLIVDDSATMRNLIKSVLTRDPAIAVVGQAADPLQARQAVKDLNPDVMTLDVEMPNMNGLEFLEKVMRLRPLPVIMVSSLTPRGGDAAIKALEIGAIDCIGKPSVEHPDAFCDLAEKVKVAAKAKFRQSSSTVFGSSASLPQKYVPDGKLVAIGASTGGVEALAAVVAQFPANCPPTVIVLHMPKQFTTTFTQRLDRIGKPRAQEAVDGVKLVPGNLYVAPGTHTHLEVSKNDALFCRLRTSEPIGGHRPAVDALFNSVAASIGPRAVGVLLTGMGRDGADGLLRMRRAGARTLGQDQETSVIYGMPKVAFNLGAVEKQVPLQRIGIEILSLTNAVRDGV